MWIRYFRKLAGMEQWKLGVEAGLGGQTAVSKIETGEVEPHIDLLGAIALALRSDVAKNPIDVMPEDFTRHTGWDGHSVKIEGPTAVGHLELTEDEKRELLDKLGLRDET